MKASRPHGGQEAAMRSAEEKRETGTALMIIGWVMVLFAFLVMFYQPAAVRLGESRFQIIAAALILIGLVLNVIGARVRAQNR
jgi:NADH:ubiquinone oxidoreductase subunit 6 (subunit J)